MFTATNHVLSQIITMLFDDVAHSFFNPFKSNLFNEASLKYPNIMSISHALGYTLHVSRR